MQDNSKWYIVPQMSNKNEVGLAVPFRIVPVISVQSVPFFY